MSTNTAKAGKRLAAIRPLEKEARRNLPTIEAAQHLNVSAQTMRKWACKQSGPLTPVRIAGRLAWPVASLLSVVTGNTP